MYKSLISKNLPKMKSIISIISILSKMKKNKTISKKRPKNCECDNTHENNKTCCMPCWKKGFRSVPK